MFYRTAIVLLTICVLLSHPTPGIGQTETPDPLSTAPSTQPAMQPASTPMQTGDNVGPPSITRPVAASNLTTGPGARSALSAFDGGRIVFTSYRDGHRQIYAMDPDGTNQVNLSNNSYDDDQPAVSPLSGQIAFTSHRDGNWEIYRMDADGGAQTRLMNTSGDEGQVNWSPDGSKLVFVYQDGNTWALKTMAADGSGERSLLADGDEILSPSWSPDGTTIAFAWNDQTVPGIYSIPAQGGQAQKLLDATKGRTPSWSPDGSKLAVSLGTTLLTESAIYVIAADGSGTPLRVSPGATDGVQNGLLTGGEWWPRWSPDGQRILYQSTWMGGTGGTDQLYVTLADGSSADVHTNLSVSRATDAHPDWSAFGYVPYASWGPLGAYQTGGVDGTAQIHLYDASGSLPQDTVVVQGSGLRLAGLWADWLVYQQVNDHAGYDIFVYNLQTQQTRNISLGLAGGTSNRPFVDGNRVVWREVQGGQSGVSVGFYVYDLLTEDLTLFSFSPSLYDRYSRYRAQDGRLVFVDEANHVHLVDLNDGAGATLPYTTTLAAGLSGNLLAALESGAGGNDVLATYTISPTARTVVTQGLDLPPVLSGETLAWVSGGDLYRQQVFDEGSPAHVAGGVGAVTADGNLVAWLDANGAWDPAQGNAAPAFVGLEEAQGDLSFLEPEGIGETAVAAATGSDWRDRWLAKVTAGRVCYLDGGLPASGSPHCWFRSTGFRVYANFELYVQPGDTATLTFKDGSYMDLAGGTYLIVRPHYASSLETIQSTLDNTFDVLTIKELEDAVEKYRQTGDTTGIDFGKLGNDATAIQRAAEKLLAQGRAGAAAYRAAGKSAPQFLQLLNGGLGAVAGASERLGSVFGFVSLIESTNRFNYPFYRDRLYRAFRDYFETVSQMHKLPDGTAVYTPLHPTTVAYQNRIEVLLRMVLRDGRTCFEETTWSAAFLSDGTFLLSSPHCTTVRWSKEDLAGLIANADTDILRREVLRPLFKDSLDWYQNVVGLFVPGEAQLALSLLTGNSKPRQVYLKKGRVRFEKLNAFKRAIDAKVYRFPGAEVLVWGTAFEGTVPESGDGTLYVEDGMPALANRSSDAPDAYAVTWQEGDLALAAAPGDGPLTIPGRSERDAPFVVELWPNETTAIAAGDFSLRIRFSQPMSTTSVTAHGVLTITADGGNTFFSGGLGSWAAVWDQGDTRLTLTPTSPAPTLDPGLYRMDLALPSSVVGLNSLPVAGTPVSTTFAVAAAIGPGGGQTATPDGAALTVPAGLASTQRAVATYTITATRVFSAPVDWMAAGGLAYHFGPSAQALAAAVTVTLPLRGQRTDGSIFRHTGAGWTQLDTTSGPGSLSASTDTLGLFAIFAPQAPQRKVYLPAIAKNSYAGPASWTCDELMSGVTCGRDIRDMQMVSNSEGWAVGDSMALMHYQNGVWTYVFNPILIEPGYWSLTALDMVSADEGWAVGDGAVIFHYQGGRWTQVSVHQPTGVSWLNDVDMVSAGEGWAVGYGGAILHYDGNSWAAAASPTTKELHTVQMVSTTEGWAGGGGQGSVLLHYANGVWQQVTSPTTYEIRDMQFLSPDSGWAVDAYGTILRYQNGAWTVAVQPGEIVNSSLTRLTMMADGRGWAVGRVWASGPSSLYYDGHTWSAVRIAPENLSGWLYALAATPDGNDVWAAGDQATLLHRGTGSWSLQARKPDRQLLGRAADMLSSQQGWLVGDRGLIMAYAGGAWKQVALSPTSNDLLDVQALSASEAWAGGGDVLLHYDGDTWWPQKVPVSVNALSMTGPGEGWAVGRKGQMLHISGGAAQFVQSPTDKDLNDVHFAAGGAGWAVGDGGVILRYINGGWQSVSSPVTTNLDTVWTLSADEAWAGTYRAVLHYYNGRWQALPDTEYGAAQILFTPEGSGWLLVASTSRSSGSLYRLQAGVWTPTGLYLPSYVRTPSLELVSDYEGWLVGVDTLLHYTGGK